MISILMPIYNGVQFLQESFDSIQKQTFVKWELLIGINGHEKNSQTFLKAKQIIENEKRARLYEFSETSKPKTLNLLKELAQNEILCLLDVDDKWRNDKLEKQFKFANQYDVIGTACQYFGESCAIPSIPYGEIKPEIFYSYNPIINSSSMFRKKDAMWDEKLDSIEDYDMWLRMNNKNKKFFNIKEILCYHRIHHKSFFNTKDNTLLEKNIKQKWAIKT